MKKVKKAIFPVGGLGTRFLPATKALPKEMLPVVDKPLIHYAFEEAIEAGIEEFIFVIGRNKNAIVNHFDQSFELQKILQEKGKEREVKALQEWVPQAGNVIFTRQQEPKGLGHAIWCVRNLIYDEPFAVLLADDLIMHEKGCIAQMIEAYNDKPGNYVAAIEVPMEKTRSYGIIEPESVEGDLVKAKSLVEKPALEDAPSNISITGRYILDASIFDYLDKAKAGSGGEIQITDSINDACLNGFDTYGYKFAGTRFDCGSKLGYVEANIAYAMADAELKDRLKPLLEEYSK